MAREYVTLVCGECRRPNYSTRKNRKIHPDRLEMKKYCRHCDRHTPHKETR